MTVSIGVTTSSASATPAHMPAASAVARPAFLDCSSPPASAALMLSSVEKRTAHCSGAPMSMGARPR